MDEQEFQRRYALFSHYGIDLPHESADLLARYAELMIAESAVQNITAVTEKDAIWSRHFLDSAYLLRHMSAGRVIDIGTGGGVPGIPLAILSPEIDASLLDSEQRKIDFCQRAVGTLGLHATAVCGRAEELAQLPQYREQFDAVVSRAMTSGAVLCELAIPFLKIGGRLYAMKGKSFSDEEEGFTRAAGKLNAKVADVVAYTLEGEQKHLIIIEKTGETPVQYPRRYAKIKRSPL